MMTLKILTYNMQAAIGTQSFRQYFTRAHSQVFHSKRKTRTLKAIAELISDYDIVCLQEVDLGGLRAGNTCQVEQLSSFSGLTQISQENRKIRNISRHGNAVLSKLPITMEKDLKLPGRRAGRGALLTWIGGPKPFYVLNVHLSLGLKDQHEQIAFLINETPRDLPVIVCGDFNCGALSAPMRLLKKKLELRQLTGAHDKTYPSWKPRHDYDHILASHVFKIVDVSVAQSRLSDHLPVEAKLKF